MTTVTPVTRIEGHLGVSLETRDDRVVSARVVGEMFRGFELILRGRDPLDAQRITQSICGICPIEHGVASVLAQEAAFGIRVPDNARLVRNLIQAGNFIASHLTHFYLLCGADFADVGALAAYAGEDPTLRQLRRLVNAPAAPAGGARLVYPAGPLLPQSASARLCRDATLNEQLLRHYGECLGMQAPGVRAIAQRMIAVFAGKMPHAATLVPGGVLDQVTALKVEQFRSALSEVIEFIERAYWPDVLGVAKAFPDYFERGRGPGAYLAYGAFPEGDETFVPGGFADGRTVEPVDVAAISEDVKHSWFDSPSGANPAQGETEPSPAKNGAYSWLKAPRYKNRVVEVGSLARLIVAAQRDGVLKSEVESVLKPLERSFDQLNSVLGRHLARAFETRRLAQRCLTWLDALVPGAPTCADYTVPATGSGIGLTEAARGALGHWIAVEGTKIARYQCVVPTTWNCSPRDDRDQPGALEQALVGTPNPNPDDPLEAMRVVRSFDPCLACAVH